MTKYACLSAILLGSVVCLAADDSAYLQDEITSGFHIRSSSHWKGAISVWCIGKDAVHNPLDNKIDLIAAGTYPNTQVGDSGLVTGEDTLTGDGAFFVEIRQYYTVRGPIQWQLKDKNGGVIANKVINQEGNLSGGESEVRTNLTTVIYDATDPAWPTFFPSGNPGAAVKTLWAQGWTVLIPTGVHNAGGYAILRTRSAPTMKALKVWASADAANIVVDEDPNPTPLNTLVLSETSAATIKAKMEITWDPPPPTQMLPGSKALMRYLVRDATTGALATDWVPNGGQYVGQPIELTWTRPTTVPFQREFKVYAWQDNDGNTQPTAGEPEREVKVVILKVDIEEVHFKGIHAKNIPLKHHDNGNIDVPEWKDTDGDGNPDEEWKNVGAWVKNSTANTTPIQVKAKFKVEPPTLTSLKVYGQNVGGPGSLYKPGTTDPLEITAAGGWQGTFQLDTTVNAIRYFKKGEWKWKWNVTEVNGTVLSPACNAGETAHDICVTAADPVSNSEGTSTPVDNWVAMASCKSADGQVVTPGTAANNKTIIDDLFDTLASCARVDDWTTKLNYQFPDPSATFSTDSLLDDTAGSCGDWRRYFFDMCAVQGIGGSQDLKMASFLSVDVTDGNYHKWTHFRVDHIGVNNPDPADMRTTANRSIVDAGKYPNPTVAEINDQSVTWWWGGGDAFSDHSIVVLTGGASDYLYDPSFPDGVKTVTFPAPVFPGDATVPLPMSHLFVQNYFKTSCPYLYGTIKTQGGYRMTHIRTADFGNVGAVPDTLSLKFMWRN